MSLVQSPNGLRPVNKLGDGHQSGAINHYPLTTNNTVVIAQGDLVALVSGSVTAVTADAVAGTLGANSPIGVFIGGSYETTFSPRTTPALAANLISSGVTSVDVEVLDDERTVFSVQANGTVPASDLGSNIGLGGYADSDFTNKTSRIYADVSTIVKTTGPPFRIVGFDSTTGNTPGDAFTQLLVKFNPGVHSFSLSASH